MEGPLTKSYIKIDGTPFEPEFKTIPDCLCHHATSKPGRESIVFVSTDGHRQSVTWSELYENSCNVAKSLIYLGLKKQEVVAINIRTCPAWLYATFGALISGAIPVNVSFTCTDGSDLIALMERMKTCSLLVMDHGVDGVNWNILRKVLDECRADGTGRSRKMPFLRYFIGYGFDKKESSSNVKRFEDLLEEHHTKVVLPKIDPKDISGLFQTSGSTGVPKLVAKTHEGDIKGFNGRFFEIMGDQYILFNDRPFNMSGGYPISVLTGQTRVTISGFCKPPKNRVSFMMETIERERCSMVFALPPLMHELIKRQDELPSDWPVIGIITGGQPLTKRIAVCVGKACQFLYCVYGGTEFVALAQAKITDPKEFTEYGCGKPIRYPGLEIKIVDEKGEIVPVNTRGEIYTRSPVIFKEYFNDPVKTKVSKSEDGWYKTDDIGRMTENGEFFVEGRKSNMIISGGINVAPEILEQVMKNFPGVDSVVLVPVPDDIYHQVLCACVIRKPGSDIHEDDLRKCCEECNADIPGLFTVLPKLYMFLETFPEASSGKICRKELEMIALRRFKPAI